jgi:hypothetical protein
VLTRLVALLVSLFFLNSTLAATTQNATASPQPTTLLQQSLAAMATNLPTDSSATGNVTITAGSLTSQGTVQILTRGANQTSVQFQTTNGNWSVIYSNGQASRTDSTGTNSLPLELAASSQSPYFPLAFLSGLLSNPDIAFQFIDQ